jgi:pimeloyl-ACP methyl ester carboxylesterase
MPSSTKYAKSGDVHIAYQVIGRGDLDLVVAPGFISHVEHQLREPSVAHMVSRCSAFARLVLFDKRGTGLSDPVAETGSLEDRVDDMRAVLDAAGSTRAAIFGASEGGPMAAVFAAAYPERTSSLILYGSFARQRWAADYPMGTTPEQHETLLKFVDRWGDGVGLAAWAPSMAKDPAFREWWAELQRLSASPGMIRSLFNLYPQIDVRSVLPAVRVPL